MASLLLLCAAAAGGALPGQAGDVTRPVTVHVVTADGKPAAGATVWVYPYSATEERPAEPKPVVTDANGDVRVGLPQSIRQRGRQAFVRDAAGRIGQAWLDQPWSLTDPEASIRIVLLDVAEAVGRVTTADGRPVAGAEVTPTAFQVADRNRRVPDVQLPAWEQVRRAVRTDSDGRFRFPAPVGYDRIFRVKADRFGESEWFVRGPAAAAVKLAIPGGVAVSVAGINPNALKGEFWALRGTDRDDGPTHPLRYRSGKFDGTANLTIPGVLPGRYEFSVSPRPSVPGVAGAVEPFQVAPVGTAAVKVVFGPAATVSGKVTDAATGRGLAGAKLMVQVGAEPVGPVSVLGEVETAADGTYTAHGPTGWFILSMPSAPDGYATPRPKERRPGLVEPARVEVGKSHTFPAIVLPRAVALTGRVVFPDGKPAAGVVLRSDNGFFSGGRSDLAITGADGTFILKNLPPDDAIAPRVRLGGAVNVPETFELERTKGPITIVISPENAARLRGRVVDGRGQPLAGAAVALWHQIQGVGRNARSGVRGNRAFVTTGADGRYEFAGLWPNDRYGVQVSADGYTAAEGNDLVGTAGSTQEFATVRLVRANLAVVGIVVGPGGAPVSGVEVFSVDGPTRFSSRTTADGRFTLTGFHEGAGFVLARKAGYRLTAVPVMPGNPAPVTVTLTKADAPPPALNIPPDYAAALEKLTRHALTLVWDNRVALNYGGNALEHMARLDPATARKWRDQEKERTGGKTDYTWLLGRVERERTLFDTARADIDEAVAALQQARGYDGFWETFRLGERLLAVDKAKAARLAEEAAVRARQTEPPAKVWMLADAGTLAVRAGNPAGRKLIEEAADLAEKLGTNDHDILARGIAASRLAPFNWPRAKAMLDAIRDPSEYNRYLRSTVAQLAATDLPRAKQLLDQFRPDNASYRHEARVRLATRIALDRPGEAVALVDGVREPAYRFLGYLKLATVFAPTDKSRAVKLIDAGFDLLDGDADGFRSWSNYGERAGFAAVAAVRAQQIGHPDVPGLIARTLALRPAGQNVWGSPEHHAEQTVNVAAVLALIDPLTARHLLATVAPPDEYVTRALSHRRDWLFALALADPERATVLADRLMERARTARDAKNGLSGTGLVELGTILTSRDRLTELTGYGNIARELGDED